MEPRNLEQPRHERKCENKASIRSQRFSHGTPGNNNTLTGGDDASDAAITARHTSRSAPSAVVADEVTIGRSVATGWPLLLSQVRNSSSGSEGAAQQRTAVRAAVKRVRRKAETDATNRIDQARIGSPTLIALSLANSLFRFASQHLQRPP